MSHTPVVDRGKGCTGLHASHAARRAAAHQNAPLPSRTSLLERLRSKQRAGRTGRSTAREVSASAEVSTTSSQSARLASPGFFDSAIGSQFANRPRTPTKPAPKQSTPARPASPGFFDNAVGSEFAKRASTPNRTPPSAPKGFFDDAVGAQFARRSEAPAKPAPRQPSSSSRASSGKGFFDNAVGSEFAKRSPAPAKPAPKQSAPRTSGKCSR
ncbi:hypothetical protein ABBQ32_002635 [Trebouxia sp. C0010 RCD-2024]